MTGYQVVGCRRCDFLQVIEAQQRHAQQTIQCRCCGATHQASRLRAKKSHETRAGAEELRSRLLADRAGQLDDYQDDLDYAEMAAEVDSQIEGFVLPAEKMDLTPIGSEIGAGAAEESLGYTDDWFADEADPALEWGDLYADQVQVKLDEEWPRQYGAAAVREHLDEPVTPETDTDDVVDEPEPPASNAGLIATDQVPLDTVTVDATDHTATDLWRTLLGDDDVQAALVDTVRQLATDRSAQEFYDDLDARDLPDFLYHPIWNVAKGWDSSPLDLVARTRGLAWSHPTNNYADHDDVLATAGLFDALEGDTTVAIKLDASFCDRRRGQREALLKLVATLAQGFDVRVVCSYRMRRWLASKHRDDLPGVADWCKSRRNSTPTERVVDDARAELDPDGRPVKILRDVAGEPSETLSFSEVYARATVEKDTVRPILKQIDDLGLVEKYGPDHDRRVDLLEPGRQLLARIDAEEGRQQTLEECVADPRKSHPQAVLSAQAREGREGGSGPYRTRFLDRARQAAAAETTADGAVTLVSESSSLPEPGGEAKTKYVSLDDRREEAVVSVRATGGFQYVVSTATALADPDFLQRALDEDRLDQLEDPPAILRDARNIGALSNDALEDAEVLRENLVEWGEEIEDLTTKLQHEECDDRSRFRRDIMRSAHGLAGSIVHLLDAVDVRVVRDVRVPSGLDRSHLDEFARSISISAAIQSRYGVFASYRQLFEQAGGDPDLTPTVDAEDPFADLVGGFVLRGSDIHRLQEPLEARLSHPADLQDDASEFIVRLRIRNAGRQEFGAAVGRVLARKRLRPTRETVSLLYALAPSPFDAAEALLRGLAKEPAKRELRVDEVRTALATLDADRLLPDLPRSAGKISAELLQRPESERVSQRDLADAVDCTTRTVRNHKKRLEPLGLLDVTARGIRLTLTPAAPTPAAGSTRFVEYVDEVLKVALPEARYGDPEDPVAGVVFWPPDPWRLADHDDVGPWIRLAGRLAGAADPLGEEETVVEMGPRLEQTALVNAARRSAT